MSERENLAAGNPVNFVPWEQDLVAIEAQAEALLGPQAYRESWDNLLRFADHPEPALEFCDRPEYTKTFARAIAQDIAYVAMANSPASTVSGGYFNGEGEKKFRFGIQAEGQRIHCSITDKLPGRPLGLIVDAYLPLGDHVNTSMMNATRHPRFHGEKLTRHFPVGEDGSSAAQRGFLFCVHELVSTLIAATPSSYESIEK